MKEQTRHGRGTHTTYIELAAKVVKVVSKGCKEASFSAGLIARGIGAKHNKVSITAKTGFVVLEVVMKDSKQEVRVFSVDPNKLFRVLQAEYRGAMVIQKND